MMPAASIGSVHSTQVLAQSLRWLPVVGHEEFYEVSDHGHVRRIRRVKGAQVGRCLHPAVRRDAYYFVILCCAMQKRTVAIHSLVADAFLGPRPEGHEVNHIDGNKLNNRADNLEYVTRAGNANHAIAMGLRLTSFSRRLQRVVEEQAGLDCLSPKPCGCCKSCVARSFVAKARE